MFREASEETTKKQSFRRAGWVEYPLQEGHYLNLKKVQMVDRTIHRINYYRKFHWVAQLISLIFTNPINNTILLWNNGGIRSI